MPALFLLIAMLLLPLNLFAHEATSGASKDTHAWQLIQTDCCTDEREEQSDHCPGNGANGCCDSEECCPDTTELPILSDLKANIPGKLLLHSNINTHITEVYLTIFVPPES